MISKLILIFDGFTPHPIYVFESAYEYIRRGLIANTNKKGRPLFSYANFLFPFLIFFLRVSNLIGFVN